MGMLNLNAFLNLKEIQKGFSEEKDILSQIKKRVGDSEIDDIKDLLEDILQAKGKVDDKGYVTCYYALSKYNKKSYLRKGEVSAGSDTIYVSTKFDPKKLKKFGESALELHIPIERLYFLHSSSDECNLKLPFRSSYRILNLSSFSPKELKL